MGLSWDKDKLERLSGEGFMKNGTQLGQGEGTNRHLTRMVSECG